MEAARNLGSRWQGYTEWLTPVRVAAELSVEYKRVLRWMDREKDPLPSWMPEGNKKCRRVNRKEMNEWIERNWERI